MPGKRSASPRAETAPGIRRAGSVLEAAALMLLLLVVAMRPLISETYDSALQPIAVAAGGPSGANPATSLWFDLAIWAAALAGLGASLLGGRAWGGAGAEAQRRRPKFCIGTQSALRVHKKSGGAPMTAGGNASGRGAG